MDIKNKYFAFITFISLLIIRLLLLGINDGEYTDGILMITQFTNPNDIYPPFYSLTSYLFGGFGAWPELGGKLVSAFFSSALVFILYSFTLSVTKNKKTAAFAALIYFISPSPLRWGIRVMSDALFSFIFLFSVSLFFLYYRDYFSNNKNDKDANEKTLLIAVFFSVLSTLTHYRGIILFPLSLFAFIWVLIRERRFSFRLLFANLVWGFIPLWIYMRGFRHFSQIEERMGFSYLVTFFNYVNVFECFVLLLPYFITFPIALFILSGIFRGRIFDGDKKYFSIISFFLILELLVLQSVFSSFQERYFLPVFPLLFIFASIGLEEFSAFIRQYKSGKKIFTAVLVLMILWGMGFSFAVCYFQKGAFGDIKKAGKFVADLNLPENTKVYSTEYYKEDLTGIKLAFWSGRKITFLKNPSIIEPGSIVLLHSSYGGMRAFKEYDNFLKTNFSVEILSSFESQLIPIFPEIMEEPGTHQNPMAFVLRYMPQRFETRVYRVNGVSKMKSDFLKF